MGCLVGDRCRFLDIPAVYQYRASVGVNWADPSSAMVGLDWLCKINWVMCGYSRLGSGREIGLESGLDPGSVWTFEELLSFH